MNDDRANEWQWAVEQQEQEQWIKDENAQREYQLWLDTLNELNTKD